MKTTTNERSLFFTWTCKSLKYFFLGSIGFTIAYVISTSFGITIPKALLWSSINLLWRLGITIVLVLGIAIVVESWR